MPLEKKHFFLGMNQDIEDRLLKDGEYRYALNVRSGSAEDADVGAITNARGNTLVTYSLPGGINEVIGAFEDNGGSRVIYFLCNSNNRHQILEYSISSNTIGLILESKLLNFSPAYPIWHIDLADDDLLFWTDNYNEPSNISIKRAKEPLGSADGYPDPFIRQYLDVIKYPPLCPPTVSYKDLTDQNINNLKGALYQFKYRFVYFGGSKSAWSPISKVALPEYGQYNVDSISKNNAIQVSLGVDEFSEEIEVAARENTGQANTQIGNLGDFFLVKTIKKSEATIGNNFSFDFLNDEIYSSINLNESNKLYDHVPIKAQTQSFIENRMIYSNILTQYNLEPLNLKATEFLDPAGINIDFPELITPISYFEYAIISGQTLVNTFFFTIDPTTSLGTEYNLSFVILNFVQNPPLIPAQYDFFVTVDGVNVITAQDVAQAFVDQINNTVPWAVPEPGFACFLVDPNSPQPPLDDDFTSWPDNRTFWVNYSPSYWPGDIYVFSDITTQGEPTGFKKGAKHEFGIVYSDEKGRLGSVQIDEDSSVYASNWAEAGDVATYMDLEISSKPPIWATKFHIMYSMNQTTSRFLQYIIADVTVSGDNVDMSIVNLINFNSQNANNVLSYDFTKGDRVRFIRKYTGNLLTTFSDIEILKYDSGTATITVEDPGFTIDQKDLIEIYTPKKNIEGKFFFEIGECLSVGSPGTSSRSHQGRPVPLSLFDQNQFESTPFRIRLKRGDIYYKVRSMPINSANPPNFFDEVVVEDYNYSDFYISNSFDKGRVGVVDELFKQVRLSATAFISEVFVPDTSINGLGSFYGYSYPDLPARTKDYDKKWGSIQRIYAEGKKLNLFQELKVGKALVGESVIFDQTGVPTINKSNEILSDIIYYPGEYGIGIEPGSFAVYGHTKYFADMKRGSVLSLAGDTIKPISKLYMHNYFTDTFKEMMVKKTPQAAIVKNTFFGVYDIKFSEYILSLRHREHPTGTIELITFTGSVTNGGHDNPSYFCLDSLQILFFSVGDTVQITVDFLGTYFSVEVEIGIITGNCFIPAGQFNFSLYPDGLGVTIVNLSNHTYNITFDPRIEQTNDLFNDLIGVNTLNVSLYNRQLGQDEIITANVSPQVAGVPGANYVYFAVDGTQDIPIDAVNDGDTVTLYDYHFEEHEITTTLAFNSGDERWKTFYSFMPEMMVGSLMEIVTFKNGALYLHNSNETHNNFYGDQFDSEVHPVSNGEPSARKLYLSMVQESNKVWRADSITNQQGQQSSLIESDFEDIEGDFYAQFLKDENTPVTNPLIEGDDLRSHELKVEMKNKETGAVKLFSVGFNWSPSERTNK